MVATALTLWDDKLEHLSPGYAKIAFELEMPTWLKFEISRLGWHFCGNAHAAIRTLAGPVLDAGTVYFLLRNVLR